MKRDMELMDFEPQLDEKVLLAQYIFPKRIDVVFCQLKVSNITEFQIQLI